LGSHVSTGSIAGSSNWIFTRFVIHLCMLFCSDFRMYQMVGSLAHSKTE
jgi:hypothetical protein